MVLINYLFEVILSLSQLCLHTLTTTALTLRLLLILRVAHLSNCFLPLRRELKVLYILITEKMWSLRFGTVYRVIFAAGIAIFFDMTLLAHAISLRHYLLKYNSNNLQIKSDAYSVGVSKIE
jgi:hypothetical protein